MAEETIEQFLLRTFGSELAAREAGRAAVVAVRQAAEATLAAVVARQAGGVVDPPLPPVVAGPAFYVGPNGNDAAAGTEGAPFRTIARGKQALRAGVTLALLPGAYGEPITCEASGAAAAPIRIVSVERRKAIIKPSSAGALCNISGDHVHVEGFDLDGTASGARTGAIVHGEGDRVIDCDVHHIAQGSVIRDSNGGAGIVLGGGYWGKGNQHAIGNTVRTIAVAGSERFHGIYHQSTGSVVRNLVYDVRGIGITLWHSPHHVDIIENTVAWAAGYGIAVGAGDHYPAGTVTLADFVNVLRNIVADCAWGIGESGDTGPNNAFENNTVFRCGNVIRTQTGRPPVGTLTSDPMFVGPDTNDYRLQPGSPSAGRGAYP